MFIIAKYVLNTIITECSSTATYLLYHVIICIELNAVLQHAATTNKSNIMYTYTYIYIYCTGFSHTFIYIFTYISTTCGNTFVRPGSPGSGDRHHRARSRDGHPAVNRYAEHTPSAYQAHYALHSGHPWRLGRDWQSSPP